MFDNSAIEKSYAAGMIDVRPPDMTEQLVNEKAKLESRLRDINDALAALAANPEVEKILRLVHRVSRF